MAIAHLLPLIGQLSMALIILAVSAQITIRRKAGDSTAGERRWKF